MTRALVFLAMALAVLWSVVLVAAPAQVTPQPFIPLNVALIGALVPGGLMLTLMIFAVAIRRFLGTGDGEGMAHAPGSGRDIDQRVLNNTIEQIVLALALWPAVALVLGGLQVIVLGLAFALARIVYWIGYHTAAPLRIFGFMATFYPTVAAILWTGLVWVF